MAEIKKTGIKVEGRIGLWYEIAHIDIGGTHYYVMESEIYGDEADHIVINEENIEYDSDISYHIIYEVM